MGAHDVGEDSSRSSDQGSDGGEERVVEHEALGSTGHGLGGSGHDLSAQRPARVAVEHGDAHLVAHGTRVLEKGRHVFGIPDTHNSPGASPSHCSTIHGSGVGTCEHHNENASVLGIKLRMEAASRTGMSAPPMEAGIPYAHVSNGQSVGCA
eukprot:1294737-Rhodomonas_salina.7